MDELLRMPDESEAIDRLRALRAEHMRQQLSKRHEAIVCAAHAQRLTRLFARARESPCLLKELKLSIVTQRFPTVRSLLLECYDVDDTAFDWNAHLDALEKALEADFFLLASLQTM
jgi:hypothetical protein